MGVEKSRLEQILKWIWQDLLIGWRLEKRAGNQRPLGGFLSEHEQWLPGALVGGQWGGEGIMSF